MDYDTSVSICETQVGKTSLGSIIINCIRDPELGENELKIPRSDSSDDEIKGKETHAHTSDSQESLIHKNRQEKWWVIAAQVSLPFLIAGTAMCGAGFILNMVKEWKVFKTVPEFLVLVTPLLGLKGNLEMVLASRLSTHANLGHLNEWKSIYSLSTGNLCLILVQAIVVGFLASLVAIVIGSFGEDKFVLNHALLLCLCSILTAGIASISLGLLMIAVIVLSTRLNINPDNIATPIAASLGDVTTLSLLAYTGTILYNSIESMVWICSFGLLCSFLIVIVCSYVSYKNPHTKAILFNGWAPVLLSMGISSCGGLLLDIAESKYSRIALFQPLINGVGGNLVSVQASRISSYLHINSTPGKLSDDASVKWYKPWSIFTGNAAHATSNRVLLGLVIPGQALFTLFMYLLSQEARLSLPFYVGYLVAALFQVFILLNMADLIIKALWKRKIDPDNSAIPFLTSSSDLIGTILLLGTFALFSSS